MTGVGKSCCSIFEEHNVHGQEKRDGKGSGPDTDPPGDPEPESSGKREPTWGCSSVGRAPALQAGGHGFESHHLHLKGITKRDVKNGLIAQLVRARA